VLSSIVGEEDNAYELTIIDQRCNVTDGEQENVVEILRPTNVFVGVHLGTMWYILSSYMYIYMSTSNL
jgi:hypothetical protein